MQLPVLEATYAAETDGVPELGVNRAQIKEQLRRAQRWRRSDERHRCGR
jgi:hypothetical protein